MNSPTVLSGTYDPQRLARLTLIAEDKFPLPVVLDAIAKTWQCRLEKGFQSPGTRWLRLSGFDDSGNAAGNLVIYLNVSNNPLSLGQLSLKVVRSTLLKARPVDSIHLQPTQTAPLKAEQRLEVVRYGYSDGHLQVELREPIAPVGKFGYIYEDHAELTKGNQVLKFELEDVEMSPLSAIVLVTTPTMLKLQPVDSTHLQPHQQIPLLQGQTLRILGCACTRGHFRLALVEAIPGFGKTGFVYWEHVQIKRGNDLISYDPTALTITAIKPTLFKKRPLDSVKLSDTEKTNFRQGSYFGVSSYAVEAGHLKVSITEELPGFGNTGYVFPGAVQLKRGTKVFNPLPPQVELNIPYFSQRDNPRSPNSTCNVTAIAMALHYFGVRSRSGGQLENELLQWIINRYGSDRQTDNHILAELIKAYGFPRSSFSTLRKWADVKNELLHRRPVVLGGDFTASGHIVCLIGYTPQGYIVNDPWGNALMGYTSYEGRKLLYPYSYMDRVAGPDGRVWAHFFAK